MNRPTRRLGTLHRHARRVSGGLWPYVAGTIIVMALVGGTLRLGMPWVESSRPELEHWLSTTLKHPVSIGSLEVRWQRWTPEVLLSNVVLQNPDSGETAVRLADLRIRLSLWASIAHLRPVPSRLIVSGGGFALIRDVQGRILIQGIKARGNLDLAGIFFTPDRIEIRSAQMVWQDQVMGTPAVNLSDVAVRVRNTDNRHRLDGQATLPGGSGRRVRFLVDLSGNPLTDQWDAEIRLSAQSLPLHALPVDQLHPRFSALAGTADVELWSTWERARLTVAESRFRLVGVNASFGDQVAALRWARGTVSYRRTGDNWQLAVDGLELATHRGRWPQSSVEITVSGSESAREIGGRLRFLDLDDTLPAALALSPLDAKTKAWLGAARPSGKLRDAIFLYRPSQPVDGRLLLNTRLDAVTLNAHGDKPGFQGLSGTLRLSKGEGRLILDSDALVADVPKLFTKPIKTNRAFGELRWQHTDKGWQAFIEHLEVSNRDALIRLAGSVDWPHDDPSPFLDIQARFENADVEAMPRYLPVRVMPKRITSWLVRALPAGVVKDGGLVLRGRAADFPFDAAQGRFEVRAKVTNAVLDYSPAWPRMQELRAELVFSGRSLDIYSDAGKIFDANLLQAHAHIPNLRGKPAFLELSGEIRSTGSDGLRFLMESPLRKKFHASLGSAEISDAVIVKLDLGLVLGKKTEARRIQGSLSFPGNNVDVGTAGLQLDALRGTLNFTAESLTGEGLAAKVWGLPVTISVEDVEANGERLTRFTADGQLSADQLVGLMQGSSATYEKFSSRISPRLQGTANWRAQLDVPDGIGRQGVSSTLRLESDLKGMALELPEPLGKTPQEARRLTVVAILGGREENQVRFRYGDDLQGALALRRNPRGLQLSRAAVYMGAAQGELPATEGLFVHVDVQRFSSTDWLEVLRPADADKSVRAAGTPVEGSTLPLKQIYIKAKEFELVGQWVDNMHLQADRESNGAWRADLRGDTVAGVVTIPSPAGDEPVSLVFERLELNVPEQSGSRGENWDPRTLPPLELSSERFSFGDLSLGRLTLASRPHAGGMHIEKLSMVGEGYRLEASGDWWFTTGEPMSRFKIRVTSPNQGDLLKSFGYDQVLKGGAAEVVIDANWRGSPSEFSLAQINGLVYYRADDGRVADLEPGGAGRVFGLLSVHALPRRLRLDFSDTFKEGFSYDRIEGNFTLYEGNAYTNDLYVRAPAARIDIAGRVGLAEQDYDQLVTVTPEVSSTFAIGGAIAGGPIGAATALLAQQLFRGPINKSVERQYRVSGNWSDPQVVRVEGPAQGSLEDEAES